MNHPENVSGQGTHAGKFDDLQDALLLGNTLGEVWVDCGTHQNDLIGFFSYSSGLQEDALRLPGANPYPHSLMNFINGHVVTSSNDLLWLPNRPKS